MANYRRQAIRAARQAGIDPHVFLKQINLESGFNPGAVSPAGAIGIAQFMPGTAKAEGVNPRNPRQALFGAARLDAKLIHQTGSYRKALAAYNAGPGNIPAGLGYADSILHGQVPKAAPHGGGGGASTKTIPGVNRSGQRRQLLATYLLGQNGIGVGQGDPLDPTSPAATAGTDLTSTLLKIARTRDTPAKTVSVKGGGGGRGRLASGGVISRRTLGRTDQGVDFTGAGPVPSPGDGVITRVVPHGGGSGWPGGGFIVVKLDRPVKGHRFVYVAENISPKVRAGQRVRAGEKIAHAHGSYPFLETGFAADANGTTLAHATTGYSEGQRTKAGKAFKHALGL